MFKFIDENSAICASKSGFELTSKIPLVPTQFSSSKLRLSHPLRTHRQSICFTLVLATITSWLALESGPLLGPSALLPGVQATLWPKARICFNSVASSFQSECVYCDSRLFASTITACTGQPVLANNITQAQAFCIATACLQVDQHRFRRDISSGAESNELATASQLDDLAHNMQQTGKQPTILGRRKRSLQFRPLSLGALNVSKSKPYYSLSPNGNVTAQFDKSPNGTTSGNLAFVLNRPAQVLWLNPLSRVLMRNSTNKNLQWQFGKANSISGRGAPTATAGAGPPPAAASPPRPPAAAPRPAAPGPPAAATTARPAAPATPAG